MELDEAFDSMRRDIRSLYRALTTAERDATNLHDVATSTGGELLHLRYHIRRAERAIDKLYFKTLTMPPLDKVTEENLDERALAAANKSLAELTANSKKMKGIKRRAKKK